MNKDVIYIEPEEDITDIIAKVENAKTKIVALVPPKKAGVFRSIVNIKLITKSAAAADKTVVLVTTDPSIIKLAAATKMPVTKDLKSAPEIPTNDEEIDETETVDVDDEAEDVKEEPEEAEETEEEVSEEEAEETEEIEENDESKLEDEKPKNSAKKAPKNDLEVSGSDDEDEEPSDSDSDEKPARSDKKAEKREKPAKNKLASSNNPVLRWIGTHKKADIAICSGVVVLILVLVWMFAIAPAVTITLKLETVTGNFSENVTFTENLADEKVEEGKFYIKEVKSESKAEVEFEATGTKNVGEKASGTVVVYAYFKKEDSLPVRQGSTFTYNGMNFVATEGVSMVWDGKDATKCDNNGNASMAISGCQLSARVKVEATESGAGYNVSAATSGWSTNASGVAGVYSDAAMSGGTDKNITIVQQSDIDKAIAAMNSDTSSSANRTKLYDSIENGLFAIDSSYKQEVSNPVSSPAVGEEVESGKKAKLTVTTTDTVFTIDTTKMTEFIEEKAKLQDGYKIYTMNDPFVENFTKTDAGYIGKLKTSYVAGSTITENEVVETVKGKGIGSAKRDLSDNFNGIKTITIDTSVPWVTSVPGNTEKITVKIDVAE